MPETKKYAILCSTQEQARECKEKGLLVSDKYKNIYNREGIYPNQFIVEVITYEEAVGLGLLGEKWTKKDDEICELEEQLDIPYNLRMTYDEHMGVKKEEVKEESKIEELKNYKRLLDKDIVKKINEIIRHLNK